MLGFVHADHEKRVYALKLAVQELLLASASTWLYCRRAEIQSQAQAQNSYLNKTIFILSMLIIKIKHLYYEF